MTEDSVVALHHPGVTADPLTAVLRAGARELLAQAIEAEVAAVLAAHEHLKTEDGRRRLVRHGHGPERAILTGIGPVSVRRPKVRDRGSVGGERIRFTSAILPRFARRTRSLDAVLPTLYLRGVSSGDFQEALEALLGKDASGLSAQVIGRLKAEWEAEHERWRRRDLSARRYVYMWADGIYLQGRLEDEKQCILVLIGATPEGRKELVGFQAGVRESAQSWRELLACLRGRGLTIGPEPDCGPERKRRTNHRTLKLARQPSTPHQSTGAGQSSWFARAARPARGLRADRRDKLLKWLDTGGQNCTPNNTSVCGVRCVKSDVSGLRVAPRSVTSAAGRRCGTRSETAARSSRSSAPRAPNPCGRGGFGRRRCAGHECPLDSLRS